MQIVISDNGIGFDIEKNEEKVGIGLSQVKARIKALDGILKISSSTQGTRIYISVPIIY